MSVHTLIAVSAFWLVASFSIFALGDQGVGLTSIQTLDLGLSNDKQVQLTEGWNAVFTSGDVSVAIAAVGLLDNAPPQLRSKILGQSKDSRGIQSLFESLNGQQRDQLISSLFRYPELVAPLAESLSNELLSLTPSQQNLQYISDIVAVLKRQPPLNPLFYKKLIKLEHSTSDIQVRQTLATLLIAQSSELKGLDDDLRALLDSSNPDEKQLATQLMLKLNMRLPENVVDATLNDAMGLQPDAIRYLGFQTGPISQEHLKVLIPILAQPSTGEAWNAVYSTLEKKHPDLLQSFFTQYKQQFDALAKQRPSTLIAILKTLPTQQDGEVATWPLIDSKNDDCEAALVNLMLLQRRSEIGSDFATGLWSLLQGRQNCLGKDQTDELGLINRVLSTQGSRDQFSTFLVSHIHDAHWDDVVAGVATITGWLDQYHFGGSGTTQLQVAFSGALGQLVNAGSEAKALALLRLGVPFRADSSTKAQLLTRYHNQDRLNDDGVLEMLGRLGDLPQELKSDILSIAKDPTKRNTTRQAAIQALANTTSAQDYYNDFVTIAQEPSGLPSIAAIDALTKIYARPNEHLPLLSPSTLWLQTATNDRFAQASSSRLLEILTTKNNDFASLLLQSIPDPTGYRCWDLAVVTILPSRLWLTILDDGLAHPDRLASARACVMLLTSNQSSAGLISSALTGPRSQNTPTSSSDRTALLSSFSDVWEQTQGLNKVRGAIANQVDLLSPSLPYSVDNRRELHQWSQRLRKEFPEVAQRVGSQATKQTTVLLILGLPIVVLAHLALWLCIIFVYPHSPAIQSLIFWNRLVRKLLSLGYMDVILLAFPGIRRRLFQPLKEQMLGEVLQPTEAESDRLAYFSKGRVKRVVAVGSVFESHEEESIGTALDQLRGRTLLLGASGLGKSSFLRNLLTLNSRRSDSAVYLPASRCGGGVDNAIATRVHLFSQDRDLLHSLIHAGRLEVYIDGYNEVDPSTQEEIASFAAMFGSAKILVTSQIPIRGLSRIETFELQPLTRKDIEEFLIGRDTILPAQALFTGSAYRDLANKYLENLWQGTRPATEVKAIEQVLSNPMDLTTTALVLASGKEPSLLALQEQQFLILQDKHIRKYHNSFRTQAFSEDVFQRRLNNDDDLDKSGYDREVASLVEEKMAITRAVEVPGKPPKQEILFRHDRIRDYFTHFAFLDEVQDPRRLQYANDSRFAGVYEYLARMLDLGAAERLREQLLMSAVESQDHRLSDSFIKQLSWRQQFASSDPKWLGDYDLPAARDADLRFDALQQSRSGIEAEMLQLRETMSKLRELSRILSTAEESALRQLSARCLEMLGGLPVTTASADHMDCPGMRSPNGTTFCMAVLTSRTNIDAFQVDLVSQRIKLAPRPVLLITNSNVAVDPSERNEDLPREICAKFQEDGVLCCSAVDIYQAYRGSLMDNPTRFWSLQETLWERIQLAGAKN